jgi:hypothetical protein
LADYCINGYRLPKLHGKPNPADARKIRQNKGFCHSSGTAPPARLRRIHCDI